MGCFDRFGKLLHAAETRKRSGCKAHTALAVLECVGVFSARSSATPGVWPFLEKGEG